MLDKEILRGIRPVTDGIARVLVRVPVSPDEASWAGLILGGFACLFAMYEMTTLATIFLLLNRLCDGLDGALARVKNEIDVTWRHHEARGKFLDIICDHIFFAAFPLSVAIGLNTAGAYLAAALYLFGFVVLGASSLAYGILVSSTPPSRPRAFQFSNLSEGSEMFVYLLVIAVYPAVFSWLTIPFALLCMVSAIGRVRQAYQAVS